MTLNTNGLSFEAYEKTMWLAAKQSALNPAGVWDAQPAVKNEIATQNGAAASAKSGAQWNALLLARAKIFSANPNHQNLFQADPLPTEYALKIASDPGRTRYFFNSRACTAFMKSGVPVSIGSLTIQN